MKELIYQARWALPIWFIGAISNWWPDNRVTIRIRGILLAPFFKKCGKKLTVASNVVFRDTNKITIGDGVYFGPHAWINGLGGIVFEDEVVIGPFVTISSVAHVRDQGSFRYGGSVRGEVSIGRGTWLAAHVSVAYGVTIGAGSLIGANSAVVKSIPDNVIAGGVPAKVIKECEDRKAEIFSRFR